jgi:hypothetical protein
LWWAGSRQAGSRSGQTFERIEDTLLVASTNKTKKLSGFRTNQLHGAGFVLKSL